GCAWSLTTLGSTGLEPLSPALSPEYRNVFHLWRNSMFFADADAVDRELADHPTGDAPGTADEVGQGLQAAAEAAGVAVVAFDLPAQRVQGAAEAERGGVRSLQHRDGAQPPRRMAAVSQARP